MAPVEGEGVEMLPGFYPEGGREQECVRTAFNMLFLAVITLL